MMRSTTRSTPAECMAPAASRRRRFAGRILAAGLLTLLAASCGSGGLGDVAQPQLWLQLQGNMQGSGFNAVHTTLASPGYLKWAVDVGNMAHCSPVVDYFGNVWVANVAGELIQITPAGVAKRVYVGGSIVSSPAVDDDNRILVLSQYPTYQSDGSLRTRLHAYDPVRGFTALPYNPTFQSTASPKVWHNHVFVPSGNTLRVFDRWTLAVVEERTACSQAIICGGGTWSDFFESVKHITLCIYTLGATDLLGLTDCYGFTLTPPGESIAEPSVAIVDNPNITGNAYRPIVLMATSHCITAFNFNPVGTPKLSVRWQKQLLNVECTDEYWEGVRVTTPAVLNTEQVVIGYGDGRVKSFHIDDGHLLWAYDVGAPVQAPPVAALRQIYVVSKYELIVLDSNGVETSRQPLAGYGGGASLSLDFVYVMATEGLHTFSLDANSRLVPRTLDNTWLPGTHFGFSVPAIGPDGTVYLATPNGVVVAYGAAH